MEYFIGVALVVIIVQLYRLDQYLEVNCRNQVKQAEQTYLLIEAVKNNKG